MPPAARAPSRVASSIDPGWPYVIAGLALVIAGVLVPARNDLKEVRAQLRRLEDAEAVQAARLSAYSNFLDDLEAPRPDLVRRLAAIQLNRVPAEVRPILVTTPTSTSVTDWIDGAVAAADAAAYRPPLGTSPGSSPGASSNRTGDESALSRLTDGSNRLWLLGGAVFCIFTGLVMGSDAPPRSRRLPPARVPDGGRARHAGTPPDAVVATVPPDGLAVDRIQVVGYDDRATEETGNRHDIRVVESAAMAGDMGACVVGASPEPGNEKMTHEPGASTTSAGVYGNGDMLNYATMDEAAIDAPAIGTTPCAADDDVGAGTALMTPLDDEVIAPAVSLAGDEDDAEEDVDDDDGDDEEDDEEWEDDDEDEEDDEEDYDDDDDDEYDDDDDEDEEEDEELDDDDDEEWEDDEEEDDEEADEEPGDDEEDAVMTAPAEAEEDESEDAEEDAESEEDEEYEYVDEDEEPEEDEEYEYVNEDEEPEEDEEYEYVDEDEEPEEDEEYEYVDEDEEPEEDEEYEYVDEDEEPEEDEEYEYVDVDDSEADKPA